MIQIRHCSAVLLALVAAIHAQQLNDTTLGLIRARMNQKSTSSWEMGTRAQTLTELDYPSISVFSSNYLSPTPPSAQTLDPVLSIARNAINSRTNRQLVADGSAADPASLGVAVLLGNFTNAPGANWASAARDQLNLLLYETPRSKTGAISHRTDSVQLWSDYIYMVPPFLAYYGVVTSNSSLIAESFRQIKLYRDALLTTDGSSKGLWKHVVTESGADWDDQGHWSSGNGWATAGMLRVLGTIKYSPYASQFSDEQNQLIDWVDEIHSAMFKFLPDSGIFYNYADDDSSFTEAASTALLASTVYRLVAMTDQGAGAVPDAERARKALYAEYGATHFDGQGWLQPVVNPMSFKDKGEQSPEGQAFVLQMNNNWNLWKNAGSRSAATKTLSSASDLSKLIILSTSLVVLALANVL